MKNEKYRSLMVTPAFVGARRRKERNEYTYGRVLPPSSALERPKTKPIDQPQEIKPKTSPPRLTNSTLQDARKEAVVATHSAPVKKKPTPGEHLKSWIVPKRLTSSESDEISKHLACKPDMQSMGKADQKCKDESELIQRSNSSHSPVSHHASNKQSLLPHISSEKRRESSNSLTKESKCKDFDKEWLKKFDKEERQIIEGILKNSPDKRKERAVYKQTIHLRNKQNSNDVPLLLGRSGRPYLPVTPSHPNILHKTSSVAWRRDSTWLKPIRASYQSWHGLPVHQFDKDIANITALYMRPHKKTDSTFIIHPEWGCKV